MSIAAVGLPPVQAPSRSSRMRSPALTLATLSGLTLALHLRDPHQHLSWGMCPSAALGIWCPACGGLRAVNDLGNGHLGAAVSSNLAFCVALPFVVVGLVVWTLDCWRGVHREIPPHVVRAAWRTGLVLLAVFTVLRNLPVGAWLAP